MHVHHDRSVPERIYTEILWAILFLLFVSIVMAIAAFNIGLWKVEVNDMEITYRSTFGRVRKYYFADITKGVYKKSGAFRVYIDEKEYLLLMIIWTIHCLSNKWADCIFLFGVIVFLSK